MDICGECKFHYQATEQVEFNDGRIIGHGFCCYQCEKRDYHQEVCEEYYEMLDEEEDDREDEDENEEEN